MLSPFKNIGDKIIQQDEQENVGQFKDKKEEKLPFVEKNRDQPEQVDVDGDGQEPDGHQDVGRQVKTDAVKVKITAGIDEHDGKQHNADQPEKKVLKQEMQFPTV